jgi:hypothetical protein
MMAAAVTLATVHMGAGPIAAFAQTAGEESQATSSGDAGAEQALNEILFGSGAAQTSATPETNNLDDTDATTIARTNAPEQTQEEPITADVEAEGLTVTELLAVIQGLLGGGVME